MFELPELFQPHWKDVDEDSSKHRKRELNQRAYWYSSIRVRRSTWQLICVATVFLMVLAHTRHHYENQLTVLNDQIMALSDELLMNEPPVEHHRSESKFVILTFETRDVTFWRESLGNKFNYARRHGYDFIPIFELPKIDSAPVWAKIPLILQSLNMGNFDWVLWMDFDTLFSNMSMRMEDFMEDVRRNDLNKLETDQQWADINMIAAGDCGKLNAGVMFFRNSAWTRSFLNTVWTMRHTKGLSEQDAMRNVLEGRGEYGPGNKHFLKVPQFKMNSYPEPICRENHDRPWWPGDWIIHFPGAWAYLKDSQDPFGEMVRMYYPLIVA